MTDKAKLSYGVGAMLLACLVLLWWASTGKAATVDFACTLPTFLADSVTCAVQPDSLKNLGTVVVYVSTSASLTDSTVVLTQAVAGQEGRAFNFSATQPTWTTRWYWLVTRDLAVPSHRSCGRSNVVARTVYGGVPNRVTDLRSR